MNKTVALHTLGCKLNFSETSTIGRLLENDGFEKRNFDEVADVYVINTCSVTQNADKECRMLVRRIQRKAPEAMVVISAYRTAFCGLAKHITPSSGCGGNGNSPPSMNASPARYHSACGCAALAKVQLYSGRSMAIFLHSGGLAAKRLLRQRGWLSQADARTNHIGTFILTS